MSTVFAFGLNNDALEDSIKDRKTYLYAEKGTESPSLTLEHARRQISPFRPLVLSPPDTIEFIKQAWKGVVLSQDNDTFTARLEDKTQPGNPDEVVTLALDEVPKQEQYLIETGAMFSWYIGYRQGEKYPRERFSKIRLSRLPKWTAREIQDAHKRHKEYIHVFHPKSI